MSKRKLIAVTCMLVLQGQAFACFALANALPRGWVSETFLWMGLVLMGFMVGISAWEQIKSTPDLASERVDRPLSVYVLGTAGATAVTVPFFSGILIGLLRGLGIFPV